MIKANTTPPPEATRGDKKSKLNEKGQVRLIPPPVLAKQERDTVSKKFYVIHGKNEMCAQMLEVSLIGTGSYSASKGMRGQWSND